jgi:hypothetical protein
MCDTVAVVSECARLGCEGNDITLTVSTIGVTCLLNLSRNRWTSVSREVVTDNCDAVNL